MEAISQKSESSGDCLSFMFRILEQDKSSLKISFTFQNTVAGWVRIWLISSVIVLVCVCVCVFINRFSPTSKQVNSS